VPASTGSLNNNEHQVLSLTMATNNLALSTPSSSPSIASSPHPLPHLGHPLSVLTNCSSNSSNNSSAIPALSQESLLTATSPEDGGVTALFLSTYAKGKRRTRSGCGQEGLMVDPTTGNSILSSDSQDANHKKIANRRSRGRLSKAQVTVMGGAGHTNAIPPLPTPPLQGTGRVSDRASPFNLGLSPSLSPSFMASTATATVTEATLLSSETTAPLYFTPPSSSLLHLIPGQDSSDTTSAAPAGVLTSSTTTTALLVQRGRSSTLPCSSEMSRAVGCLLNSSKASDPGMLLQSNGASTSDLTQLFRDLENASAGQNTVGGMLAGEDSLIPFDFSTSLASPDNCNNNNRSGTSNHNSHAKEGGIEGDGDDCCSPSSFTSGEDSNEDEEESGGSGANLEMGPDRAAADFSERIKPKKERSSLSPSSSPSPRATATPMHSCPLCPKKFTRPFNLRSHLLAHGNVKPYECDAKVGVCGSRFTRRHDLVRHIKSRHLDYEWPTRDSHRPSSKGKELPSSSVPQLMDSGHWSQ